MLADLKTSVPVGQKKGVTRADYIMTKDYPSSKNWFQEYVKWTHAFHNKPHLHPCKYLYHSSLATWLSNIWLHQIKWEKGNEKKMNGHITFYFTIVKACWCTNLSLPSRRASSSARAWPGWSSSVANIILDAYSHVPEQNQ